MMPHSFFVRILFLVFTLPVIVFCQSTLRGKVVDAVSSETLIGVNVVIEGTSLGAATDIEGQFRIVGIPERIMSVKASCVGYEQKTIEIDFSKSKEVATTIQLKATVIEGEEVVVTAQMRGQIAAINQQVTSNTIINVVSEEKIKELPDANAAEAIGRLPGVSIIRSGGEASKVVLRGLSSKFSNITVDGVKIPPTDATTREVDLSTISQGALAGIELHKAITADKDADAIAGSVNLVTKKAPTEREIRFDIKGVYNRLMNSINQYDFSAKYGERFFQDLIGVQLSGNFEKKIRSNEKTETGYRYYGQKNEFYEINNFNLQFIDEMRKREGLQLILDFNTPDDGNIKFNNIYAKTKREYHIAQRNYPVNDILYSSRIVEREIHTFNSSLNGSNHFFGLEAIWGLSYAQSKNSTPIDFYLDFLEDPSDTSGYKKGVPGSVRSNPEQFIPYAWNNYRAASCSSGYDRSEKAFDKERTAYLDLKQKYSISSLFSGEAKTGIKYKEKNRIKNGKEFYAPYYLAFGWKGTRRDGPKPLIGTRFERFYNEYKNTGYTRVRAIDFINNNIVENRNVLDKYLLTPILDKDAIKLWRELNIDGYDPLGGRYAKEYHENPQIAVDDYDVTERVTALYLMNTLNIGQSVTLITGLRGEKDENNYNSKFVPQEVSDFPWAFTIIDTSANFSELLWLPNFHLNVKATDYLTIRLAAYKALARPDFNFRLIKYAATKPGSVSTLILGNPNLRNSKAWNYEVNTSIYGSEIGLISISGFYKEIKDMFHLITAPTLGDALIKKLNIVARQPSFGAGTYQITVPYNSDKPTKVWGLEYEHQMNFGFLPGLLKNFVLSYNFTIARSETYLIATGTKKDSTWVPPSGRIPGMWVYTYSPTITERKQKSQGQPELFGNLALGYDIGRLSVRLSVFYQGEYNNVFSSDGTTDQIVSDFTRWDVIVKQNVTENIAVILNVNNITNVTESTAQMNRVQNWNLPRFSELYGTTADIGISIKL